MRTTKNVSSAAAVQDPVTYQPVQEAPVTHARPARRTIVSAPFSFSGATQRIWRMVPPERGWVTFLAGLAAVGLTLLAWGFVFTWYTLALTFVGLWIIPYRLVRRGQRRRGA